MSITVEKNDVDKNIYFIDEMVQNAGEKVCMVVWQ